MKAMSVRFSRREASEWWRSALVDLEVAERMLNQGYFNYAAFLSHQAVEKALRALIIERLRVLPPKIHNLVELASALRDAGVDVGEVLDDIKDLNPHYLTSRYPDAANGVPSEIYTRRVAAQCLTMARRVLSWAERLLSA